MNENKKLIADWIVHTRSTGREIPTAVLAVHIATLQGLVELQEQRISDLEKRLENNVVEREYHHYHKGEGGQKVTNE